jgi:phosphate transport system permease protein
MATNTADRLVSGQSIVGDVAVRSLVGLSFVTFVVSWLLIFQWVGETATVEGIAVFDLLGLALLVLAIGLGGLGLGSRVGLFPATPSGTAGLGAGFIFSLLWGGLGWILMQGVLGFEGLSLVAIAMSFGVTGGILTVYPREDIGSTLPVSVVLASIGIAILLGLLGPDWVWEPSWSSALFPGSEIVPGLTAFGTVLGAWSAAKAMDGFGAEGRETGAFYLIGTLVFGMLAVLGLLIAFIVANGLKAVLTGVSLTGGTLTIPVIDYSITWIAVPFVTNVTGGLFVEIPGVLPAIIGTLWLVVGAVLFAVPLGVGAAVFLTEYAEGGRFTQVVEVATNGLWSTPSIVFGLFGLAFLVPRISGGNSILVGQLVLGFMLLPLVLITSREAIKAVPDAHRDASAALGVTKWETIKSVVIPSAMPGTITGVILGVGRIAGETAPLLLVFGGAPYPDTTPNVLSSFRLTSQPPFITNDALLSPASALPYQLYSTITAGVFPKEAFTNTEFGWGTALVLLLVVLGFYAIGVSSRIYFRRKLYNE